jgi:hypothetical protein
MMIKAKIDREDHSSITHNCDWEKLKPLNPKTDNLFCQQYVQQWSTSNHSWQGRNNTVLISIQ